MVVKSHAEIRPSRSIKKPFKVILKADNGEVLMAAQLFTTRRNCIKNLLATMKVFGGEKVLVHEKTKGGNNFIILLHAGGYEEYIH